MAASVQISPLPNSLQIAGNARVSDAVLNFFSDPAGIAAGVFDDPSFSSLDGAPAEGGSFQSILRHYFPAPSSDASGFGLDTTNGKGDRKQEDSNLNLGMGLSAHMVGIARDILPLAPTIQLPQDGVAVQDPASPAVAQDATETPGSSKGAFASLPPPSEKQPENDRVLPRPERGVAASVSPAGIVPAVETKTTKSSSGLLETEPPADRTTRKILATGFAKTPPVLPIVATSDRVAPPISPAAARSEDAIEPPATPAGFHRETMVRASEEIAQSIDVQLVPRAREGRLPIRTVDPEPALTSRGASNDFAVRADQSNGDAEVPGPDSAASQQAGTRPSEASDSERGANSGDSPPRPIAVNPSRVLDAPVQSLKETLETPPPPEPPSLQDAPVLPDGSPARATSKEIGPGQQIEKAAQPQVEPQPTQSAPPATPQQAIQPFSAPVTPGVRDNNSEPLPLPERFAKLESPPPASPAPPNNRNRDQAPLAIAPLPEGIEKAMEPPAAASDQVSKARLVKRAEARAAVATLGATLVPETEVRTEAPPAAPAIRLPQDAGAVNGTSFSIPTETHVPSPVVLPDIAAADSDHQVEDNLPAQPRLDQQPGNARSAPPGELAFAARLSSPEAKVSPDADAPAQDLSKSRPQALTSAATVQRQAAASSSVPSENAAPTYKGVASAQSEPVTKADAALPQAPPAVQSQPTGPTRIDTPAAHLSPAARTEQVIEPPAEPVISHRDITVRVPDATERGTDVRFMERGGEVRVSVRTTDTELAQTLRSGLNDFVGRMEHSGIQAEVWSPGSDASPSRHDSQNQPADQNSSGRGQSGSQDREHDRQDPNKPRWVEELETSIRKPTSEEIKEPTWTFRA